VTRGGREATVAARLAAVLLAAVAGVQCSSEPGGPGSASHERWRAVTPGDTVTDQFLATDSVVHFSFHAAADGLVTLFLKTDVLNYPILGTACDSGAGGTCWGVTSVSTAEPLLAHRGDPFPVRAGGVYVLNLLSWNHLPAQIRFLLYPVNELPESRPDTISAGTVYGTESLETIGDIDRFRFHVQPGEYYAVYLQPASAAACGDFVAKLSDSPVDTLIRLPCTHPPTDLSSNASTWFTVLTSNWYTLSVESALSDVTADLLRPGGYTFEVLKIDPSPEGVDSVLAPNDTVTSALDYVADVDRYVFDAQMGDTVDFGLQVMANSSNWILDAGVHAPSGDLITLEPNLDPIPVVPYSIGHFAVPVTGRYSILVSAGVTHQATGPYRLFVSHRLAGP